MTPEEKQRYYDDFIIKTWHQDTQFKTWVNNLKVLNRKLKKGYDPFHQSCYYITFYELLTEGIGYSEPVPTPPIWGNSPDESTEYLKVVNLALLEIKSDLTDIEFEIIEYKRHFACHIFQDRYEYTIRKNGTLGTDRKGKNLDELRVGIDRTIERHGGDRKFDKYLTEKFYLKIKAIPQIR